MTILTPWALGPFEVILHAEGHYRIGKDLDRRIAVVGYDNAIELAIHTYLNLHPLQRQGEEYRKADVEGWLVNFHTKIDFLEAEIASRNLPMMCAKAEFIWFHEVRNGQYHVGGAAIPQERELAGIRAAAIWVFGILFDAPDCEALLEQHLAIRPDDSVPKRTAEEDRLIDNEFGMVEVVGKPFYASEVLHAIDPVLYSETAADVRKRDAANAEMDEEPPK